MAHGKGRPRRRPHPPAKPITVPAERAVLLWDIVMKDGGYGPGRAEIDTDAGEVVVYSNGAVTLNGWLLGPVPPPADE